MRDSPRSKIYTLRSALENIPLARYLTKVLGESAKPADSDVDDTKPTLVKTVKRMLGLGEAPLVVKGHDDLLVFRAKCCNPDSR